MTYSVKEIFYTLQGEGANAGRPAVFCRFAGCNLWSGREQDRASAQWQLAALARAQPDFGWGGDLTLGGRIELQSTPEQFTAFHGREPGPDWREATPQDIQRAAGGERPHIVFLSAPCKGFSGLLSETKSLTEKYQALNRLTLRGIWLLLEAYKDDPVELILEANRIGGPVLPREDFIIREVARPINEIALENFVRRKLIEKNWTAFGELFGLPSGILTMPENIPADKVAEYEAQAAKAAAERRVWRLSIWESMAFPDGLFKHEKAASPGRGLTCAAKSCSATSGETPSPRYLFERSVLPRAS